MVPLDFMMLAQQCAPRVAPSTMAAIVRTESAFNPNAIGVVGGRLVHQPADVEQAVATVRALDAGGWNYSAGLAQVNRNNWSSYGLVPENAFEPCRNLAVGAAILERCFRQAHARQPDVQRALRASLSCYASGDFATGYRTGYVQRVVNSASGQTIPMVPAIQPAVAPLAVVPLA